jgi:hypothetical protein
MALTEMGVVPQNWEQVTLGELTIKVGSGITPLGGSRVSIGFQICPTIGFQF